MRRSNNARSSVVAAVLAVLMVMGPAASAEAGPPDRVDPPAPGEGTPLADPTEPLSLDALEYAAQPRATIALSGRSWRRPAVRNLPGGKAAPVAAALSRKAWPQGARSAVLVRGGADLLSAAALAKAVDGPILVTGRSSLAPATDRELRRLAQSQRGLTTVYVVGSLVGSAAAQAAAGRAETVSVGNANRYTTSVQAATLAGERGADTSRVIVTSGKRLEHAAAVAALAGGTGSPVLLARRTRDGGRLAAAASDLGARETVVVGPTTSVDRSVERRLPRVTRVVGNGRAATAVAVARHGAGIGVRGRPTLVADGAGLTGMVVGAHAGANQGGPVLSTAARQLSGVTARWLETAAPARMTVHRSVGRMTRCQVGQGALRPWRCVEREMKRQGYVMGRVDGRLDRFSVWAIYAFEKVAGRRPDGRFGEGEWKRLLDAPRRPVRRPHLGSTHIEIDISRQLILLVKNGKVAHHIHTSTGKSSTPTIRGNFTVYEMRSWRQANGIYKGIFFHGGYAIHGYPKIPLYPASAGCARTYDGNQDFLYKRVFVGERVATY